MVNKGRIHRATRKFMMISLILIKLDDESMIEIGEKNEAMIQPSYFSPYLEVYDSVVQQCHSD